MRMNADRLPRNPTRKVRRTCIPPHISAPGPRNRDLSTSSCQRDAPEKLLIQMMSTTPSHHQLPVVISCSLLPHDRSQIKSNPSLIEGDSERRSLFLSNHGCSFRTPSRTILYPSPTPQLEGRRLWRLPRLCSCWWRDVRHIPALMDNRFLFNCRSPSNPLRPNRISVLVGQEEGRVSRRKACPKYSLRLASRGRLDCHHGRCVQNRLSR